ncbi:MAG: hypothetical protein ABI408_10500 [Gemmatimonadaceae bacterium]
MMSPTNSFVAVLYAVVALAIVAITYFGPNAQVEQTLRLLVLTASVVIVVHGFFRRNPAFLLFGAGLFLEVIDPSKRILFYVGLTLFLAGFALHWARHRKIHSDTPQSPRMT